MTYEDIIEYNKQDLYHIKYVNDAKDKNGKYLPRRDWVKIKPKRVFREDLYAWANTEGVHNEKAIKLMVEMAWDEGHSSGFAEVAGIFMDLLDIAKVYEVERKP